MAHKEEPRPIVSYDISNLPGGLFSVTMDTAKGGEEIIYCIGGYVKGPHKQDAMAAAMSGLCFLYQRKLGNGLFAYIACKAKGKKK